MKQPPIKTKELSGSTVQIADGQNWEIASITAYGENAQDGTTEAPVALTGVDSVFAGGNNLLPKAVRTETTGGITFTPNPDGSILVSGTATTNVGYSYARFERALLGRTVCLSGGSTQAQVLINERLSSGAFVRNVLVDRGQGISGILTKQKEDNILYATIQVLAGTTVNTTIYPMLNLGESPLPYEPYQGSVTQLPIPRPLRRVGDVRDVCVTRQEYEGTEKLVVTYNVGFVELDGTEAVSLGNVGKSDTVQQFIVPRETDSKLNGTEICTHAIYNATAASGGQEGFKIYNADIIVLGLPFSLLAPHGLVVDDTSTYAPACKAWLAAQKAAGTPVQVAYQLATPEVYATDPVDFDNTAGPLTIMTGGELEVTLTHRMLTPYTTWAIRYDSEGEYTGDFFNVEDYDRIKQNIEYLREYAYFLYGGFTMRGMVAVTVESYGYASTIDALDANLEAIAANTFRPPDMLPVKQWRGNQPPPGADDWNRIENTCLLLFEQFERQSACLPKLAFELKGSAF